MRKSLFYTFLVFVYIWSWSIFNVAKAEMPSKDYTEAVIGHVITNAGNIDHSAVMNAEIAKIAHSFSIDILETMQKHLPNILEGVIVDMKLKADADYKCKLTPNYKTKDCK